MFMVLKHCLRHPLWAVHFLWTELFVPLVVLIIQVLCICLVCFFISCIIMGPPPRDNQPGSQPTQCTSCHQACGEEIDE
jgi:hypothetical protein